MTKQKSWIVLSADTRFIDFVSKAYRHLCSTLTCMTDVLLVANRNAATAQSSWQVKTQKIYTYYWDKKTARLQWKCRPVLANADSECHCVLSPLLGNQRLAATPPTKVVTTTPRLAAVGTWYPPKSAIILAPMKPSTSATALSRYLSSLIMLLTNPYSALKLKMANMFEEYTMKGSVVMPKTCRQHNMNSTEIGYQAVKTFCPAKHACEL